METDQPKEGLRELRIAAQLDPDSALVHHCLGTALFEVQNFDAAVKELREAVRLEPSADNHYFLAACLMSMDRDDEALSELEIASSMKPEQQLFRARKEELMKSMAQSHVQ
jgi:Flp pilus assembly protein TadD